MTILSLPPLAGFYAKLYALNAFLNEGYFGIATIAILFSV
jgi:NADH:ubiquinone oxidoreductase subunit 2 (subunit N)